MFWGLFIFGQHRCIRGLSGMAIFLDDFRIFWNVENTLPIRLKHSKFCSFMKTISLKQKLHVLRTFQFWPKSRNPHLTGVAIFLVDFRIFWNVENTLPIRLKHSKFYSFMKTISLKQKRHVLRTIQFWPKSLYPDLTGVAIFWLILVFFEMLKIPFQFVWNIQNFILSWKQSVWSKNCMFWGLFNFGQNRCIWGGHFFVLILGFFEMLKIPYNSSETFKILVFHENHQFEARTACFEDFSGPIFWPKSLYPKINISGPNRRGHFFVDFRIFWTVENTLPIRLKHSKFYSFMKTISLKQKRHVLRTFQFWPKSLYPGWPFFLLILGFFEMLKIPFQFVWNIQNFILSWKQSVWSKNGMFWGLFNFGQNRCIRTGWPFFLDDFRIFWNVENTLQIRLKHSKFYSFMKTISLKEKRHVLRTFQFWPKSLYPDLTGGHFFWLILGFFEILKIPFQFVWNIQNFILSWKQSVWSKNCMFWGLFNFGRNRCIWGGHFFCWF